jgi:hypothetical protein
MMDQNDSHYFSATKLTKSEENISGWLLVLAVLLIAWAPLNLASSASRTLAALPRRGLGLAAIVLAQVFAAALGVAAGLALIGRRPGAVRLARVSLGMSAIVDILVYVTPYYPRNRPPGDDTITLWASLAYYTAWLLYLWRSNRVKEM